MLIIIITLWVLFHIILIFFTGITEKCFMSINVLLVWPFSCSEDLKPFGKDLYPKKVIKHVPKLCVFVQEIHYMRCIVFLLYYIPRKNKQIMFEYCIFIGE